MTTVTQVRPTATTWPLWGGHAFVAVEHAARLPAARRMAQQVLEEVDASCSRFRRDSDLSRANRSAGHWVRVNPLLVAATRVAVAAAVETDGLVDPALGRTMVSLGYDLTCADLEHRRTPPGLALLPARPSAWRDLELTDDAIRVPHGVQLDLGATAKAWAADLVAAALVESLTCSVVVSLLGDVRVLGPDERPPATWPVRIGEVPADVGTGPEVTVSGGLATSSTMARRWHTASGVRHHLIDPRTGAPVPGVFRTVSAVGHTCVAANVATTAALVLGPEAPAWLTARDVSARLVAADGEVISTGHWPDDVSADDDEEES